MNMTKVCGVLFAVVSTIGCNSSKAPTAIAAEQAAAFKPCDEPKPRECKPQTCGGNSPAINAFPVQGVRPDGQCSHEGAQLVPGSLATPTGTGVCHGATLDVDDGKFVGRKGKKIVCTDVKLLTFEVRGWQDLDGAKRSVRIQIADVKDHPEPNGETRTAYRLVDVANPNLGLCGGAGAKTLRDALGLSKLQILGELQDAAEHDLVIPIVSELYDAATNPVEVKEWWEDQRREWIHFACVDDALAKRSLYDLHTDNLERSRAALRMLTADYCGGFPVTTRGVKIDWSSDERLEARWSSTGASCLSEYLRLLYKSGATAAIPTGLPPRLQCASCATAADWGKERRKCEKADGTWEDRIPYCPQACTDATCKRQLVSHVVLGP